ncbi:hypothetical protein H7170_01775 [Candidatus Gracilibacteria bacterium]|nr:hypothetical protein [Candidatus Gracilibacteria bacterium]
MKSPLKIGLNLLTLGLIGLGVYNANKAEAINNITDGYQVTGSYDLMSLDGCTTAVNPSTSVFLPTRTWEEWNSVKAVAPSRGISLMSCTTYMNTIGGGFTGGDACGDASAGDDCGDF